MSKLGQYALNLLLGIPAGLLLAVGSQAARSCPLVSAHPTACAVAAVLIVSVLLVVAANAIR